MIKQHMYLNLHIYSICWIQYFHNNMFVGFAKGLFTVLFESVIFTIV